MSTTSQRGQVTRRDFLRLSLRAAGGLLAAPILGACRWLGWIPDETAPTLPASPTAIPSSTSAPALTIMPQLSPTVAAGTAPLALVRTRDRTEGVRRALALLGGAPVQGLEVLLKPNFNSADPAPASTHIDTLRALATALRDMGAARITIADRSGMGNTRQVMESLGVFALADELGCEVLAFDELREKADWELVRTDGDHWRDGFPVPHRLLEAGAIVQTCCLKPHRFGGHFTLSLKNSVGMVGKHMGRGGHNYMTELHTSTRQRLMIAEINAVYQPALVLLDGVEAFIDNGPETGTKVWAEVILAGIDRVAIDAAGLALLRLLGYTGVAASGPIFAQEQIARAVELGLGIDSPEKITFLTDDAESAAYAEQIKAQIAASG
jgi:uncharacterized protein (DUF362 family)